LHRLRCTRRIVSLYFLCLGPAPHIAHDPAGGHSADESTGLTGLRRGADGQSGWDQYAGSGAQEYISLL
jgi:hypothetical protein